MANLILNAENAPLRSWEGSAFMRGFPPLALCMADREFGVSHWITIAPKPDLTVPSSLRQLKIFPSWEGLGVGYPTPITPHPTPRKAFKAVCHPVRLGTCMDCVWGLITPVITGNYDNVGKDKCSSFEYS